MPFILLSFPQREGPVSKVDLQEVKNAIAQAQKELVQRYDFKGSISSIELSGEESLTLASEDEMRLKAVLDILQSRLVKRGISLKSLEYGEIEPAAKGPVRALSSLFRNTSGRSPQSEFRTSEDWTW